MRRTQTAQFFNGSLRLNLCLFSPYDIRELRLFALMFREFWGLQDKVRELCWGFARQKWQDMGRLEMKNKKQGK